MNNKNVEVIFGSNLKSIKNIYELEKIGAGHDGLVFKYNDKALKLLKYDIENRQKNDLMTFEKACYFVENLNLRRVIIPIDVLLDINGIYIGIVMDYYDNLFDSKKKNSCLYKEPGDFTCGDLVLATSELEEDFNDLTNNKVCAKDINRGSYIYTDNFMYLCDVDKYSIGGQGIEDLNKKAVNFTIAKFLFYEMIKEANPDKQQLKQLSNWVKKQSNSRMFLKALRNEIRNDNDTLIHEYTKSKVKTIIH